MIRNGTYGAVIYIDTVRNSYPTLVASLVGPETDQGGHFEIELVMTSNKSLHLTTAGHSKVYYSRSIYDTNSALDAGMKLNLIDLAILNHKTHLRRI